MRFLGPDLPAAEIARSADALGASVVAISAVFPELDASGAEEIAAMRRRLPDRVDVIIGGYGAQAQSAVWKREGILFFPDLPGFRAGLREIYARRFGRLRP